MFGIIIVLLGALSIMFGSYRMGVSVSEPDPTVRDGMRNPALVVIALGLMFLMSGVLATVSGSVNPFDAVAAK
jgi:hypothetical protein